MKAAVQKINRPRYLQVNDNTLFRFCHSNKKNKPHRSIYRVEVNPLETQYENMEPNLLSYKESLRQGASVAGASPPVYLHGLCKNWPFIEAGISSGVAYVRLNNTDRN